VVRNWGALWAFVALLALVGFALRLDLSAPYHRHQGPNYSAETPKNKDESTDYMATALAVGEFLDSHNGAVGAVATIVIAAFTVLLAVRTGSLFKETAGLREAADSQRDDTLQLIAATKDAADAAKRSADVAERMLVDAERPYLFVFGVARFKYAKDSEWGESAFVEYTVANYGRTPAIIEDARADFLIPGVGTIDNVGPVLEDHPLFIVPIIAPGTIRGPIEHHRWSVTNVDNPESHVELKFTRMQIEDGTEEVTPILKDKESLYFRVVLRYRGPFTKGHETSACWLYRVGSFEWGGKNTNFET
jgi:hypothetical protein